LKSLSYFSRFKEDETAMRFLNDPEAQDGFKNTKLLFSIGVFDYKATFYVGGHGPGSFVDHNILIISVGPYGQRRFYLSCRTNVEGWQSC
jgi:hypothetical protein